MDELFRSLPALLREFEDNDQLREAVVFAAWRKIAGESLRQRTAPLRLFRKQLVVAVPDQTWKRHLEQLSGQMIFKINSALRSATVTFIEFRIDEEAVAADRGRGSEAESDARFESAARHEITAGMRRAAKAIADPELREKFLLAAGSCLARKRRMKLGE